MTQDWNKIFNQEKFDKLRKAYSKFTFVDFDFNIKNNVLFVEYLFKVDESIVFKPTFSLPLNKINGLNPKFSNEKELRTILFQIGMIELISYWKATCTKTVEIIPYKLTESQINWWKKVYFNGLGEFFYINKIDTNIDDFMTIKSCGNKDFEKISYSTTDKVLVPIGGGKDSVVTLELLNTNFDVIPFVINPRDAIYDCQKVRSFDENNSIFLNRNLDKTIIQLNEKGFLNGHTPFSAMLAFYTFLISYIYGIQHVALSNESSANEPTIPGTMINHQYSKSFEFESDFRIYINQNITSNYNYFSFLRPLNELQIARVFSKQTQYFKAFKSCNAGSKQNIWCCNCSKCLFTYIILSPFIDIEELTNIFGENLFNKKTLLETFKQLTGISENKPFECVGTIDEVNVALNLFIKSNVDSKFALIEEYKKSENYRNHNPKSENFLLDEINKNHFLKRDFLEILLSKYSK